MRNAFNLATAGIWAIVVSAIAIISVQNATLVSVAAFGFRTIKLPFGTVLAFCLSVGLMAGAIAPILWRSLGDPNSEFDDDDYFEEDY